MPPKLPVVINTGPLIALATALDDLEALAHVALRVVVPGDVCTEFVAGAHHDDTADKVRAAICCDIRPVFSALPPSLLDMLDIGEAAVIHTALTEGITTVAIDERKGRWVARLHGLQVIGSLGMLVILHRQRVIPSIEQAIQRIQDNGIFSVNASSKKRSQQPKPTVKHARAQNIYSHLACSLRPACCTMAYTPCLLSVRLHPHRTCRASCPG